MKYTDAEFKQLPNLIYYTGTWGNWDNSPDLLNNIPYEIRTFIISYDDDDLNIIYTENVDNLLKIYHYVKSKCFHPKHTLFIKLDGVVCQPKQKKIQKKK